LINNCFILVKNKEAKNCWILY